MDHGESPWSDAGARRRKGPLIDACRSGSLGLVRAAKKLDPEWRAKNSRGLSDIWNPAEDSDEPVWYLQRRARRAHNRKFPRRSQDNREALLPEFLKSLGFPTNAHIREGCSFFLALFCATIAIVRVSGLPTPISSSYLSCY